MWKTHRHSNVSG